MTHEAKPQPGTDTLAPVLTNDKDGDGIISYGDFISFNLSTTQPQPFVHLIVSQGGQLVAQGWAGYFDGALGGREFGLYSPIWTSGAADATATIEHYTPKGWKTTASTTFHIAA